MSGDLLSGLPDALRRLLGAPPVMEKKLLELSVGWTGPSPGQARMAGALRLFVITWDPLERLAPRPHGFATTNSSLPDLEIVVYAPAWKLAELATERGGTATAVLSSMAGSAVVTAAAHEHAVAAGRYPELVTHRGGAGSAFRPHGPRALPRIQAGADVPPIIEPPYRLPIIDR